MAAVPEPAWLSCFRAGQTETAIVDAFITGLPPEELERFKKEPAEGRAVMRRALVNSECPEYRADVADGFKRVGACMRALDAALGCAPPKPGIHGGGVGKDGQRGAGAASGKTAQSRVSREVVTAEGGPGTLAIWWSDFESASKLENLKGFNCTKRLNMARETAGKLPEFEGIETVDVPMEDAFDDNRSDELVMTWTVQFQEALAVLRRWREEGAIVNVNCAMGKNRSGSIILCWMVSECGWKMDEAAERLRGITTLALANPHMVRAVGHVVNSDDIVPLNPAGGGGGWVCISPPGTPRAGATQAFEGIAASAAEKLSGPSFAGAHASQEDSDEEMNAQSGALGGLFDDAPGGMDDVDD
jgi:hypothetical protein